MSPNKLHVIDPRRSNLVSSDQNVFSQNEIDLTIYSSANDKRDFEWLTFIKLISKGQHIHSPISCKALAIVFLVTFTPVASETFLQSLVVIFWLFSTILYKLQSPLANSFFFLTHLSLFKTLFSLLNFTMMFSTIDLGIVNKFHVIRSQKF